MFGLVARSGKPFPAIMIANNLLKRTKAVQQHTKVDDTGT